MLRRAVVTIALSLLTLGLLALTLSALALEYAHVYSGSRPGDLRVELERGAVAISHRPWTLLDPQQRVPQPDMFRFSFGQRRGVEPWVWIPAWSAERVVLPLVYPLAALTLLLVAMYVWPLWRARRLRRRGRCWRCGYLLAGGAIRCPECGEPPPATGRGRWPAGLWPPRNAVSGVLAASGWLTAGLLLAVAVAATRVPGWDRQAQTIQELRPLDYTLCVNAATPALTGRVVSLGPELAFASFGEAARALRSGDIILLGPGDYNVIDLPADVLVVGAGRDHTTVRTDRGQRWHYDTEGAVGFAALTIDCQDDSWVYFRRGGGVHLRDCVVMRYNSGAGGSNAIFASEAVVLVESCLFEGRSGRQADSQSRGDAFDLRGRNLLYVRATVFADHEEITRLAGAVLDGCRVQGELQFPPRQQVYVRASDRRLVEASADMTPFRRPVDDPQFVAAMAQGRAEPGITGIYAAHVELGELDTYWLGLLRSSDGEVRAVARDRLADRVSLPPREQGRVTNARLRGWLEDYRGEEADARVRAIHAVSLRRDEARRLLDVVAVGDGPDGLAARELLRLLALDPPIDAVLEHALARRQLRVR